MAAVIGSPVDHSLSPVIHNAAFGVSGLDWVYVALPVPRGSGARAVAAMRTLGLAGMSVTTPHKADVIAALDDATDDARRLGAVNCIATDDAGRLIGHNTDGAGFVRGLADDFGFDPRGASCVVLGAGGAARAVILALARAGAARVVVVNRTEERAVAASDLADSAGSVGGPEAIGSADLVVNATSVGMGDGDESLPCDAGLLRPGQIVAELVYQPLETALMRAAGRAGARTANGTSMLVHQGAIAFEHWTGMAAPVEAMADALSHALADRSPRAP